MRKIGWWAVPIVIGAIAACGHESSVTPIYYVAPPDRGPDVWRQVDLDIFRFYLTNTGTRDFTEPEAILARGGPAVYDIGLWIGAQVNGEVRVSATSYFGSEFEPLLLPDTTRALVYVIKPGAGPGDKDYDAWPVEAGAPSSGGRPLVIGNGTVWSAYDDGKMSLHKKFHSAPLGAEVRQTVWSAASPDSVLFERFEITNTSADNWDSALFGVWLDVDLGNAENDLVGCDLSRAMGYTYNAAAETAWGRYQPALGVKLVESPPTAAFGAFPQALKSEEPPDALGSNLMAYNLLQGLHANGDPMIDPVTHQATKFAATGDPVTQTPAQAWIEQVPEDRRMMLVTTPVSVSPGSTVTVTVAILFARASDHLKAITALRHAADAIGTGPGVWIVP